ncbi:MAG: hypothetical protein AAFZ65_11690, partial [Planctomycetota bacterium]
APRLRGIFNHSILKGLVESVESDDGVMFMILVKLVTTFRLDPFYAAISMEIDALDDPSSRLTHLHALIHNELSLEEFLEHYPELRGSEGVEDAGDVE